MAEVVIRTVEEGMTGDPLTGWSAYPFMKGAGGADVRAVHVVAIYPGQVRGNHYHEKSGEYLFIFSGEGVFYWEEGGRLRQRDISGAPTYIMIPPGIKHAFRNTGADAVYLLAVRDGEFDPGRQDIVRSGLVK